MRAKSRSVVGLAAEIARRQQGVVCTADLRAARVGRSTIDRWVAKGLLHREYHGVFRFGHRAPSAEAHFMAAVLACGERAWLAAFAAAHLYAIVRGRAPAPEVVSLDDRQVRGVINHRVRNLDPREITRYRAIPITTTARTVVDLAATLELADLARACHEARVQHRLTAGAVGEVVRRRHRTTGIRKLRAIYEGDHRLTLSRLEDGFLALLRERGYPLPITNRRTGAHYVDCRWPEHRLTVELNSYRFHGSRHAWEEDHARARAARKRGDEFRPYTWADVFEDSDFMLAELAALLHIAPLVLPATAR
jgi:hypothetical protein